MVSEFQPNPEEAGATGDELIGVDSGQVGADIRRNVRLWVGIILLSILAFAAYAARQKYKQHLAAHSIESLTGMGLLVHDNGDSITVWDPTRSRMTDEAMIYLCDLDRDVNVDFNGCRLLSDVGLASCSGATCIRWLKLDSTSVTDAGLEHLVSLPKLETLSLGDTEVTDEGLAKLKAMHLNNLEDLNLYSTQITNAGLTHLSGMQSLRFVVVGATKVTTEGEQQLKQAIPHVMVFGAARPSAPSKPSQSRLPSLPLHE